MYAVGIDVSKGKSMISVVCPLGKVIQKPFEVRHTLTELDKLVRRLKDLPGETRVILEHTGRYSEPIVQRLSRAGLFVSAVNPLLVRDYGNNSIRRVKTDKADSLKIARYGIDNWADLREHTPMDTIRAQLKNMNRQCSLYSKNKTAYKNNLIALLDQTFPGVNALFDSAVREDGSQKWVDFADTFWHVDCVRGMSRAAFSERYHNWCKRRRYQFSAEKASSIHAQARELVPTLPKDANTKLLVRQAIAQLNAVSQTLEILRKEMLRLAGDLPEFPAVMGMYGVGETIGPQLIAEIGDVRRFTHKQALSAFAGVDPVPNQSGIREGKSAPSSKRGSPQLRKTLFVLMTVLLQNAPAGEAVYEFLDKKRAEGKPYYVYMTAGCNKFLRIYYGRVKEYLRGLTPEE